MGNASREILPLTAGDVMSRIRSGAGISTIKLNHGFWERVLRLEDELGVNGSTTLADVEGAQLDAAIEKVGTSWPATLLADILATLRDIPGRPGLMALASPFGWRDGGPVEGTPIIGLDRVVGAIDRYVPPEVAVYDGLVWKNATEDGSLASFVEALRDHKVLLVAPRYAAGFAKHAGLENSQFIPVHETAAAWEAQAILDQAGERIEAFGGQAVTLVEAGGLTSSWLCERLGERFPESVNLAIGQPLNLFTGERIERTNWFRVYGPEILATTRAIDPDAVGRRRNADSIPVSGPYLRPINPDSGRDLALDRIVGAPASPAASEPAIPYVEPKDIDQVLVDELLARSASANRFANFGPVSQLLEDAIGELIELPPTKRVIICKSATDGIHTLAGLHGYKHGRPLRWVTCAFGFFSTATGPLAEARLLDCDQRGMLELGQLDALPDDEWDGLALTNAFGLATDLDPYVELCQSKGKVIIVDNAVALFSGTRTGRDQLPDEAISFHQTKPWGIGEGGCMIVDAADAELARALTNFGVGAGAGSRPYARNSKYSEYDSALVLQRLVNLPKWGDLYGMQARRIEALASRAGLEVLAPLPSSALIGSVPLLAPVEIESALIQNPHLALRKYYEPLVGGMPQAADIYRRIVNVPCHPGVAGCSEATLTRLFERLAQRG